MDVKNIEEAQKLFRELDNVKEALSDAKIMLDRVKAGQSGILLRENSDGSGNFNIDYLFENDNYAKEVYLEIAEASVRAFENHKVKLETKISKL